MRKLIKAYDVYKFEELEKDIQEKVLDKYIKMSYECYLDNMLYNDMAEIAKDSLQNYFKGAEYQEVYYDLSYSQGSGAMIEFNINLKDLNNKYKMLTDDEINGLENFGGTNIKVYHNNSHYYHERTFDIEWNDFTMYTYMDEYCDNIEKVQKNINTMIDLFKEDIVSMNGELTQDGYNILGDKVFFEETAMKHINDLEFLSDGSEFNERN